VGVVLGVLFFFQEEDGIRDWSVTGVQPCALPISRGRRFPIGGHVPDGRLSAAASFCVPVLVGFGCCAAAGGTVMRTGGRGVAAEIGRAACRGRGWVEGGGGGGEERRDEGVGAEGA